MKQIHATKSLEGA